MIPAHLIAALLLAFLCLSTASVSVSASWSCACGCSASVSGNKISGPVSLVGFAARYNAECTGVEEIDQSYCSKQCASLFTPSLCPKADSIVSTCIEEVKPSILVDVDTQFDFSLTTQQDSQVAPAVNAASFAPNSTCACYCFDDQLHPYFLSFAAPVLSSAPISIDCDSPCKPAHTSTPPFCSATRPTVSTLADIQIDPGFSCGDVGNTIASNYVLTPCNGTAPLSPPFLHMDLYCNARGQYYVNDFKIPSAYQCFAYSITPFNGNSYGFPPTRNSALIYVYEAMDEQPDEGDDWNGQYMSSIATYRTKNMQSFVGYTATQWEYKADSMDLYGGVLQYQTS